MKQRLRQWLSGLLPAKLRTCSVFWGLKFFITTLYKGSASLWLRSQLSRKKAICWNMVHSFTALWWEAQITACGFLFQKLSAMEQNYDIGNWELLAVRLVLEGWRHWLEATTYSFTVFMDYKTLEYLRTTKCLNSHQAWWSLFFTQFNVTLSYHTYIHVDTHMYPALNTKSGPDSIQPPSCFVNAITWDFD